MLAFQGENFLRFFVCPRLGRFCGETLTRDSVCPRLRVFCGETITWALVCPPIGHFRGETVTWDSVCPRLGRFGGGVLLLGLWEVCFGKHILKSRFLGGTAAGIYGVRRLQVGSCGRLGLGPSSLPAVALCRDASLAILCRNPCRFICLSTVRGNLSRNSYLDLWFVHRLGNFVEKPLLGTWFVHRLSIFVEKLLLGSWFVHV